MAVVERGLAFVLGLMLMVLQLHGSYQWQSLSLPQEHIPYFFANNPDIKKKCDEDSQCPYKDTLAADNCWGYEDDCPEEKRMLMPECPGDSRGWTSNKNDQKRMFWEQADFGYVKDKKNTLKVLCQPQSPNDSSLECSQYARFCRARNIYFDFSNSKIKGSRDRYRDDLFKEGEVGGHCKLNKAALISEGEHRSPLQSWYAELQEYTSLQFRPIEDKKCDVVIDEPTFFIKLDSGVNLYHHFCDFVNLYASQHLNNSFSTAMNIVMWDTSAMAYGDLFSVTWHAFSKWSLISLEKYDGKKVCFRDAVFSLLARMRYGLFYNTPLIYGCHGSGFFRAFNQHMLHRLHIKQQGPLKNKIRVTLLDRNTTYRNILNQRELVSAMKIVGEFDVQVVEFNWRKMTFLDQITISHNSDIFIGMHGAGLTHILFQPDWAVAMEIYNCEDPNCYSDLARLRGIKYFTWESKDKITQQDEGHHPTLGAHAKFTNYAFDVVEFMRLLSKAADHVRSHPEFIRSRRHKHLQTIRDEL